MNNHHLRKDCRLCNSTRLTKVLALEPTPPANAFVPKEELQVKQERFPLDVYFCETCSHVQLLDVVNPSLLFSNYVYVSGTSPVFVKHFSNYAEQVCSNYPFQKGFVAEIGSNDGTLLKFFKEKGHQVLGIDPAQEIAKNATKSGIETIADFFSSALAEKIVQKQGKADVIVANNVFAHIDNLDDIVAGIKTLLKPDGVFVFEVSYLVDVFEKTLFDTIYHEHLCYHSVKPLQTFFKRHGMELIDCQSVDTHGGSLRAYAKLKNGKWPIKQSVDNFIQKEEKLGLYQAKTFQEFGKNISKLKDGLRKVLGKIHSEGKTVAGFGAPAKATTLMYHFGLDQNSLSYIVDDSPLKQGLYSPGFHIPVEPSKKIYETKPDYLLILAWNFADSIMKNHQKFKENGGKFIVPVPEVKIYE